MSESPPEHVLAGELPAFPCPNDAKGFELGITIRDYFAAKFMQGEMARPVRCDDECLDFSEIAQQAYEMADEMLKARVHRE